MGTDHPPLCRDCKYMEKPHSFSTPLCKHPQSRRVSKMDLVTGDVEVTYLCCSTQRAVDTAIPPLTELFPGKHEYCTSKGLWFEKGDGVDPINEFWKGLMRKFGGN